ncbi:MAG: VWA domain-containing protein [Candidatus Zixiibacteriota bacterium]
MIVPAFLTLTSSYWLWALLALVVAVAGTLLYYRRTVPPLGPKVKIPLVILRLVAALVLFLALADALWAALKTDRRLHDLIVLIDHSASMQERDNSDATRFQRAEAYAENHLVEPFANQANVHRMYFDGDLLTSEDLPDSFGASTAIGTSVRTLADMLVEYDPRAVVLLTDGNNNRGVDPTSGAARLGVPVVTVGVGRIMGTRARISAIEVPEVVLTDQPFDVTTTVQSGPRDEVVTVKLSSQGTTLAQGQVTVGGGALTSIDLSTTLSEPGTHDLRLDIIGSEGTSDPTAGRTVFVRALKGRLKVLLIGYTLDWEYSYLKRWLSNQSRIDVQSFVIGRPPLDGPAPTSSDWASADIAVLVHPTRRQLVSEWAGYADNFQTPGRGVAVLLNSRFAELGPQSLPYPFDFQRSVAEPVNAEFTLEPLATRQNHPLVRFDPADEWNETIRGWRDHPPWVMVNCFTELPADADVLVSASPLTSVTDCPGVWTRTRRGGKALVLSGGPMWRWVAGRARSGEEAVEYEAFWSNAIRWLTLRDDTDRLAVRSDRQVYFVGEPIVMDASVYDEAYRFLDRAQVTARIWRDTTGTVDTIQVSLPPGSGDRFTGQISNLEPGTYRFDGEALVDSVGMPLTGGVFRVEPYGLEQQSLSLDQNTLQAIALQTGGRYYSENESPVYLDSLDWSATVHEHRLEIPLWNKTPLLIIFIAALTIEWFIRRRRQLL